MRILLTSEYDNEVLLEDDISPTAIHHELIDRAVEIEVSIEDIAEWLSTQQQSLVVAEDYGDIISIVKQGFDAFPTMFVEYDSFYDTDDLLNQVVECPDEVEAIEMDIGENPYHIEKQRDAYDVLRRWVESNPMAWKRLTLCKIATECNLTRAEVREHLLRCVAGAKYISSIEEFHFERSQANRKCNNNPTVKPTLPMLSEWLNNPDNIGRWQSLTLVEIAEETEVSTLSIRKHLPRLLYAEGYISSVFEFKQIRQREQLKNTPNSSLNFLIDLV